MEGNTNLALGTGRRKNAIARVYLRQGEGKVTVNGKELEDYFRNPGFVYMVHQPMDITDTLKKFDVAVTVTGGGHSGQAGACRHGIARALAKFDPTNIKALRANGFLTRDPRMVERKKYGQPGARKKFQFSKR